MDETSQKIIDAAMTLIRDNGYVSTTTKEIARVAGVNECTLFRKFKNKKDIVLQGLEQEQWRAYVTQKSFENVKWDLEQDLEMFMSAYMDRMTPDFDSLAMNFFSATFGYTFLKASFGNELTHVEKEEYIKNSVKMFIKGLM